MHQLIREIQSLHDIDDNKIQQIFFEREEYKISHSCDVLDTIQEEDDEFQYSCEVEKLSKSGIMFNKRILSLQQESLCYYSLIPNHNLQINNLKHKPKARLFIKDITSMNISTQKPNELKIMGTGIVFRKNKRTNPQEKFSFTFRFKKPEMPVLWRNIILAAKEALKQKKYLMTFENLLKYSRSESS